MSHGRGSVGSRDHIYKDMHSSSPLWVGSMCVGQKWVWKDVWFAFGFMCGTLGAVIDKKDEHSMDQLSHYRFAYCIETLIYPIFRVKATASRWSSNALRINVESTSL